MEQVKLLASGLTLEESKAKRQEKQAARYRHRLGTYVPSGDSKGLLDALLATSPKKSPTRSMSMKPESTKRGKSVKRSTKSNGGNGIVGDSTQETEKQTKSRKPASRKTTKAVDPNEKEVTQGEQSHKGASRRSGSKTIKDGVEKDPKPPTPRQTDEATSTANTKATKLSRRSAPVVRSKRSKALSCNTDAERDFDNQLPTPQRSKDKSKRSTTKPQPPPTPTSDESDDLAIKSKKAPWKVEKGKVRSMDSPPEIFESAGTDIDLEDSRPGPSNVKLPLAEEKALDDAPLNVRGRSTMPIISRVASDPCDVLEEQQQKPPSKKRPYLLNDEEGEEPSPKRGRVRKSNNGDQGKHPAKTKPKRQSKKPPPTPIGTKGRVIERVDPPPETSDVERDETCSSEIRAPGSNPRRHQRKLDDDEKRSEPGSCEASSNPNRVRLDSIPPEGIIIRKKYGIVERLLPPVIKPKRKAPRNKGKTRDSHRRAIPVRALKYIGPTRFGSPLRADGTDTDDDLNL